ncbi:Maf family protein [Frisingicoccus sp.]|uniref:Maf family protein n=1 Tax=Frisingicoccus sp. TaxID=1918627 RepID=UPI003AB88667
MSKIILASASPRRRELLTQIGLKFEVMPSHKEEDMRGNRPAQVVMGLAADKAGDIFAQVGGADQPDVLVIGADTIVALDNIILGKPKDEEDALKMLQFLQGKTHQVYTGVCMMTADMTQMFYEKTDVVMYPEDEEQLREYVQTGEPMDKAGSYAIQGRGSVFIREIHGDYSNVVGLPVAQIWQRLMKDEMMRKIVLENKE